MFTTRLSDAWRKNSPEVLALFNGAMPHFVWSAAPRLSEYGIPVFGYHCVEHDVLADDFAFLVRNGYRTLDPDELVDRIRSGERGTGREVLLTFDDGPRNFVDVALPLAERWGVKATIFVAPGLLAEDYGSWQVSPQRPMTWQEVRRCHASGLVSVQSHTLESRYLPRWPMPVPLAGVDPVIEASLRRTEALPLEEDLRLSRQMIETLCPGTDVRHLCFPMYHSTEASVAVAQRAGFQGLYQGLRPGIPLAGAASGTTGIPRMLGEFVRRLPGEGRLSLLEVLALRRRTMLLGQRMRSTWQTYTSRQGT